MEFRREIQPQRLRRALGRSKTREGDSVKILRKKRVRAEGRY